MFILECTMASQHVLCTGQGDGCTLRYPEVGKATREQRAWISAGGTSKSLGVRSEAMKEVVRL